MGDVPIAVQQKVRRTRREAEAALQHARDESDALRRELALLPAKIRRQPAYVELLSQLDALDAAREHAISVVAAQGRPFEPA